MRRHSHRVNAHSLMSDTFSIVKQWTVHPIDHSFCAHCMIRCFSYCFVIIACLWMLLNYSVTLSFTRDDKSSFKLTENYRLFWVFDFHQLSCIRTSEYLYFCRFSVREGCFVFDRVVMNFYAFARSLSVTSPLRWCVLITNLQFSEVGFFTLHYQDTWRCFEIIVKKGLQRISVWKQNVP